MVYPAVGAILDRSLVAALVFVGVLGLAAAAFARAPARLFPTSRPPRGEAEPPPAYRRSSVIGGGWRRVWYTTQ